MIKPFGRVLFKTGMLGWICGLVLVLFTFPLLKAIHGDIFSLLWKTPPEAAEQAPTYRLIENRFLSRQGFLIGRGAEENIKYVSPYKGIPINSDYINDVPWANDVWLLMLRWFSNSASQIAESERHYFWLPTQGHYKTIVVRTPSGTFVDEAVQQFNDNSDVYFEHVKSGFVETPTDPFGGIFLFEQDAPESLLASSDDPNAYIVANFDHQTEMFIKEVWAIKNQNWAVTTVAVILVAGLMVALPWWVLSRVSVLYPWVLILTALNVGLLVGLLWYWKLAYPTLVPLCSVAVAWGWCAQMNRYKDAHATLFERFLATNELWVNHLLDEGKPEAAYRYVSEPANQVNDPKLWQLVAAGFERSRQFDKAISCYEFILASMPAHAYAKQRLKQLTGVLDAGKTISVTQHSAELPVGKVENLSLGRYKIISEVGRGAMGVVYQAIDPKIDRKVALKVVNLKNLGLDEVDQVKQRFFREAQAAGKLNHPNIVTVYDVGEEHDVAYIAMDYLVGKSLAQHNQERPIDLLQRVKWIAEAADALSYAHQHDVVHRDVKPANMIIEQSSGRLQLTDFGVARIAGAQQTQTGIVLGSPSYMSPEQIRGEQLTGQTDIFSLGVTLYQSMTGELPFAGDTLPSLAYAITQSKQESPRNLNPEVPLSLVRIVNKALQKKPEDRFGSAQDFAVSLHKWVSDF